MDKNSINNFFDSNSHDLSDNEKIANNLFEQLNSEQKQKINNVLNDPNLLKDLLNSPKAQELLSKLTFTEKGE